MSTLPDHSVPLHSLPARIVEGIRRYGADALFLSYMLSIAAVILSNSASAPERILLWIVLPIFVATSLFPPFEDGGFIARPHLWLGRSVIFWACVVYICAALVPTFAAQDDGFSAGKVLYPYARRGAQLIFFVAVTIWLAVIYPLFFRRFLIAIVIFLTMNAVINIGAFVPKMAAGPLEAVRLDASFGTPGFRNATHIAPLFVIYAMAALAMLSTAALAVWQRWSLGLCIFILIVAIVMTQARGALVAMLLAVLFIAATASVRRRWILFLPIVMIVAASFAFAPVRDALLSRGASFRTELWQAYLQIASAKPWLGYGLHQVIEVNIRGSVFEQPHNTLVWAQLRVGIIGTVAATVMLVGSLWSGFTFWRRTANAAPLMAIAMMAVTAITEIGFLIFPYDWLWITFWLPVAIAAGLEVSPQRSSVRA